MVHIEVTLTLCEDPVAELYALINLVIFSYLIAVALVFLPNVSGENDPRILHCAYSMPRVEN